MSELSGVYDLGIFSYLSCFCVFFGVFVHRMSRFSTSLTIDYYLVHG